MKYKPFAYQDYATRFILDRPAAAIFLEMGLGKSVIALTAIRELIQERFEVRKVLVIAPLRVARDTWPAEIGKWDHLKGLAYALVLGPEKKRREALRKRADVYIINRENVEWLVAQNKFDFDMVVIDELSSFKAHKARRFRALMSVRRGIKRIVGLTGTPSANGLMDLWAEFKLLDGGKRLGRFITGYREDFFIPDRWGGPVVYSYKLRPGAEEEIYRRISDITVSMRTADYLEMPERVFNTVRVRMDAKERETYERLRREMVVEIEGKEIDARNAAALAGKLLQMANGAVYGPEREVIGLHERKLDALEDLIEMANGKPVMVAYQYKHDKDRITKRFQAREIRESEDIADWNAGRIPLAIIHPQSAGHGLNLQAGGSTLIWYGLTWSLEQYQQANARLWRQGQKQTVIIHHIITEGTIDERVMMILGQKERTQSDLIDAVRACLKEGGKEP